MKSIFLTQKLSKKYNIFSTLKGNIMRRIVSAFQWAIKMFKEDIQKIQNRRLWVRNIARFRSA